MGEKKARGNSGSIESRDELVVGLRFDVLECGKEEAERECFFCKRKGPACEDAAGTNGAEGGGAIGPDAWVSTFLRLVRGQYSN